MCAYVSGHIYSQRENNHVTVALCACVLGFQFHLMELFSPAKKKKKKNGPVFDDDTLTDRWNLQLRESVIDLVWKFGSTQVLLPME